MTESLWVEGFQRVSIVETSRAKAPLTENDFPRKAKPASSVGQSSGQSRGRSAVFCIGHVRTLASGRRCGVRGRRLWRDLKFSARHCTDLLAPQAEEDAHEQEREIGSMVWLALF
jgi:hypothetical protein